ncbi:unnamed protein product [Ectocarpus sp. CCAP 1310/34]|nr:unnamed protein product [Ectocarpus sp. CCAP 1310/34]
MGSEVSATELEMKDAEAQGGCSTSIGTAVYQLSTP